MSKNKASGSSHYEILFIVPNKYTEAEAKQVIARTGDIIKENGGIITLEEYWGKKRLAYTIKQNHYGYYSLFEFDLEGENLAKLDKTFRLSNEILRHQIVKKALRGPEEIKLEKERREKIDLKKAEAEKDKKIIKTAAPAASVNPAPTSAKAKVDLKDLDEKLEGILSATDLI